MPADPTNEGGQYIRSLQYFTLPGLIHMESMEWGVDCRNSRWIPWNGGWNPWNGGWIPWNGGWIPWNGGWIPYFFHGMGDGLHTFLRWIPWDEGWTPHFFKMDSMEWGMDSMEWGWTPYFF